MDEFTANNILLAEKYSIKLSTETRRGNVLQVYWDIELYGYKGKLKLEVNYVANTEIRVSLYDSYENCCLRRVEVPLDANTIYSHKNPSSCGNTEIFQGIHKHKYLDRVKDGCAYVPNDIDTSSPVSIVRTFAKECNINLIGELPNSLVQRRLI